MCSNIFWYENWYKLLHTQTTQRCPWSWHTVCVIDWCTIRHINFLSAPADLIPITHYPRWNSVIHTGDHKQCVNLKMHTKMTFFSHKVSLLVEVWLTVPLLWSVLVDGGWWEHGGIMRQCRDWTPRHSCQSFQITHYDSKDWRDTDTDKATVNGTSPSEWTIHRLNPARWLPLLLPPIYWLYGGPQPGFTV